MAKEEFKRLHKLALLDPGDLDIKAQLSEASKRAIFLGEAEATFFQQRAKATHILEADKCTKYFHAIVKRNLARNTISSLTLEDGYGERLGNGWAWTTRSPPCKVRSSGFSRSIKAQP
ncbi:unnamed protein product [Cuscuta epithymum]|uniref:Uncharacterized protein n=1 Tax=Cuscuta epithymum TaxID=186058 RepID=A0AAV0D7Z0_9ASTE|nr:unnamed protein product [Cuscuta epithymum]